LSIEYCLEEKFAEEKGRKKKKAEHKPCAPRKILFREKSSEFLD